MKILITGVCGFAGSAIAEFLLERREGMEVSGIDNLMRPGSETNRGRLAIATAGATHGHAAVTGAGAYGIAATAAAAAFPQPFTSAIWPSASM